MAALAESVTVLIAGLILLGIGLLIITRQPWFVRLTAPSSHRRRSHVRRRRRPRFRRAA